MHSAAFEETFQCLLLSPQRLFERRLRSETSVRRVSLACSPTSWFIGSDGSLPYISRWQSLANMDATEHIRYSGSPLLIEKTPFYSRSLLLDIHRTKLFIRIRCMWLPFITCYITSRRMTKTNWTEFSFVVHNTRYANQRHQLVITIHSKIFIVSWIRMWNMQRMKTVYKEIQWIL